MARLRRTSTVLEAARQHLVGFKSITSMPDFGASLSVTAYETVITWSSTKLDTSNQSVAALDDFQDSLGTDENNLPRLTV